MRGACSFVVCLIAVLAGLSASATWAAPLHYDLVVALEPAARTLRVSGTVRVPAGETVSLRLAANFAVERFDVDGRAVTPVGESAGPDAMLRWRVSAPAARAATIAVSYSGTLAALDASLDHRQVLGLSSAVASAEGAFLPAGTYWYPDAGGAITYRLTTIVPAGIRGVTSGRLVEETLTDSGQRAVFETREPLPGIVVIAGPYVVAERLLQLGDARTVRIRTYFHRELETLAAGYLESAAGYIARYDREIGRYAFASYSIVSSPLPTGFGMPGIAYLGRQVLRLPFIRATSLRHEVLHDWWGNGVQPDYARGNWSEGLTTFLADYAYKEDEGSAEARAMRLGWLRDYAALGPEQDRPLAQFTARRHGADQAVGYQKSAFVFAMLRDRIGPETFRAGLRRFWTDFRFRTASWDDLRRAFEAVSGQDLGTFFAQWVERPGAPALAIAAARRDGSEGRHSVAVALRQAGEPYQIRVPLRFHLEGGTTFDTGVDIDRSPQLAVVDVPGRALSVAVDPDARIFRRLDRQEIAPILRRALLDPRTRVAVAGDDEAIRQAALTVAHATLEGGVRELDAMAADGPVFVIGLKPHVVTLLQRLGLPPIPASLQTVDAAFAYAGETDGGRAFVVVSAPNLAALAALARPLPHLGAQSYAVFDGARSVARGVWPREPPRHRITDR